MQKIVKRYERDYDKKVKCPPAPPICADCEPKHPCPQGLLSACCTGAGLQNLSSCPTTPRSLVCATIDTTCLCKPLVAVDFTSIIAATVNAGESLTLTFQVKKSCTNGLNIECGTWTFVRDFEAGTGSLITSDSFGFIFCDCNPCPACCTYAVELVSCTATPAATATTFTGSFSISAPTVSITAVDACPQ